MTPHSDSTNGSLAPSSRDLDAAPTLYDVSANDVFQKLNSTEQGLSNDEAARRLLAFGTNQLPQAPPRSVWLRFLSQFNNALLYVLMCSALATLLLGYPTDAVVISVVVLVNALVGFFQEGRAEDALRSIANMVVAETLVRRSGAVVNIPAAQLVPGDIVLINAGDRVPADMRLVQARDLRCDESALTGESVPVAKDTHLVAPHTPLAERSNCVFMGTEVTLGAAVGMVYATGLSTELGRINKMVATVKVPTTPLTRQLNHFARGLTLFIVVVTLISMAWGVVITELPWADMFRAAVGIAVAAIPEGLPAIVTVSLAIGVQRMARSKALVRKLPAVEVLGAVTVICSDKTGTLTRNEMTARKFIGADKSYVISGEGYAPIGDVEYQGQQQDIQVSPVLRGAASAAYFCNDANVVEEQGQWRMHGDPTEGALHVMARKMDVLIASTQDWHRVDVIPFSTEQRYMAVLGHGRTGNGTIFLKGAPEKVLSFCSQQMHDVAGVQPIDGQYWRAQLDLLASEGMRVLALAMKDHEADDATLVEDKFAGRMIMLGLVGIADPPRQEAKASIALCRRAGIRVMMITGDNPLTAAAIGTQLGIVGRVMTGAQLDELADDVLRQRLGDTAIFARTSPENKLRLVELLQGQGHVVAMTGDGVNDAPALRRADIGIAMGKKGTDAAREASAMVLTDDNFSSIARAVEEGRTVYDNIIKAIIFILPTSAVEASALLIAIFLGLTMPITAVQILWVNMITTVTLAIALAFESGEKDLMLRAPRRSKTGLITPFFVRRLVLVSVVGIAAVFWIFSRYQADLALARVMTVTMLVWMEVFYLFSCRRLYVQAWSNRAWEGIMPALLASAAVILMQWLFTQLPWLQQAFETQPLSLLQWLETALVALMMSVVVELDKWGLNRWRDWHQPVSA